MGCGENNTIVRFLGALDAYAGGIKWDVKQKGLIKPVYLITGVIGGHSFSGYASSLNEVPYAVVKVLLALVVNSLAPMLGVELSSEDVGDNADN